MGSMLKIKLILVLMMILFTWLQVRYFGTNDNLSIFLIVVMTIIIYKVVVVDGSGFLSDLFHKFVGYVWWALLLISGITIFVLLKI